MLAEHGYTIVTGLAEGCDAAATEGVLSAGGNIVGVVPCGLKALGSRQRELSKKIFSTGGAVISEYSDDLSEFRHHYLRRNEIITGLSEKTIIITARERVIGFISNRKSRYSAGSRGYRYTICHGENRGGNTR